MLIRCCLAVFTLLFLAACEAPSGDSQRRVMDFQVPAGGGGGY